MENESYPSTPEHWRELEARFLHAAKIMWRERMKDVNGKPMYLKMAECAHECAEAASRAGADGGEL